MIPGIQYILPVLNYHFSINAESFKCGKKIILVSVFNGLVGSGSVSFDTDAHSGSSPTFDTNPDPGK